jgi:hypothetical protein
MKLRILFVVGVIISSGCAQTLFVKRNGDCEEVYGRDATQSIYLDSGRIGELSAMSYHTGRPLDMVTLVIGSELRNIGVDSISLIASPGDGVYSGCTRAEQTRRKCFLKNSQHSAANAELFFTTTTEVVDWQVLRDVQNYWDSIASCVPN